MNDEIDDKTADDGEAELTPEDITSDDITAEFVPALVSASAMVVVDDEAVILDEITGATHLLNRTGGIVVQCFDGQSSLAEIAVDVAEAFGQPLDVITPELLALCQQLGEAGMLQGVSAHSHHHAERSTPGFPEGTILHDLDARAPDGTAIDDDWLRAERTVIINWGAQCGYCSRIVGELGELEAPLMAAGVRLMLVTVSDASQIEQQFATGGASLPVAYADEAPGFFVGLGTPVAYVVEDGAVAEPMALGALEVPELARRLAGVAPQSSS